jgi:hypothetical protein
MTTEAQVNANRANAQKSTGPRTAEGKAVVAQNAVKHGFWAQEVVIKGEDPQEFALYREGMLQELAPAGFVETLLAERIVNLSWRLRRAERMQATAFEKIEAKTERGKTVMKPEDAEWLLEKMAERGMTLTHYEPEGPTFGRKAVKDFDRERVLDRLLVYERRIEYSLYRSMAELRKLRAEGAEGRKEGGKVRRSEGQEAAYETKPIGGGVSRWKCEVSREESQASGLSSLPTSNFPLETAAEPQSCETKPISGRKIKDGEGYRPTLRRRGWRPSSLQARS